MYIRVWSNCRRKKKLVEVDEHSNNQLNDLIKAASEAHKFSNQGLSLVLECDGSEIDNYLG